MHEANFRLNLSKAVKFFYLQEKVLMMCSITTKNKTGNISTTVIRSKNIKTWMTI